jgi:glycopeptide antibiotics resistance protein
MVEFYQYIGRAFVQNKPITKEYILYSVFDVLVTVLGGVLGSIFYNFLNFYI